MSIADKPTITDGDTGAPSGIQHISIDLWMTLIRSHPVFKKKRAELFCRFFSVADLEKTERAIRRVDLMANHINETTGGNIDALELYFLVLHELDADARRTGLETMQRFYKETESLFAEYPPLAVDDSVTDGLKRMLDMGFTLNILSNTGFIKSGMLRLSIENLGWKDYFSFDIFSDEINHSKPHPAIFEAVWLGIKDIAQHPKNMARANVLHFGDNPFADVEGAQKFGFSAALFLPAQTSFEEQLIQAIDVKNLAMNNMAKHQ